MLNNRLGSFVSLCLLTLGSSASSAKAEPFPPGWQLEVNHSGREAGARLAWRLAWHNGSKEAVEVPVDLLERMVPTLERATLGAVHIAMSTQQQLGAAARPTATRKVAPGETLERVGWLGDFFPECQRGCPPGSYTLRFVAHQASDTAPPAVSSLVRHFTLQPPPQLNSVPVHAASAFDIRVVATNTRRAAGRTTLRVTLVNRLEVPVWFPKSPRVVGWAGRTQLADGVEGGFGSVSGHQSNEWGPRDAVLMRPGQRRVIDLPYDFEPGARHMWLSVRLAAPGRFRAEDADLNPFVFQGDIETDEVQVY